MASIYPLNYLLNNSASSKRLQMVVKIDGVDTAIALGDVYTRVRYGDPDIFYGIAGLVYGGLRRRKDVVAYLTMEGSLTIQQRLEPEQGRASISTFNLVILDKNNFGLNLITPGGATSELMGDREVKILMGYQNTSYPEDYFTVFRSVVASTMVQNKSVTIGLVDPNQKRRQNVFRVGKTKLTGTIINTDTTIPVVSTGDFPAYIQGPDGTYDPNCRIYLKINDEMMYVKRPDEGGSSDSTHWYNVTRNSGPVGWTATGAVTHNINESVESRIQLGRVFDVLLGDGINGITLALKIMLSGWNGPFKTGVVCSALGVTDIVGDTRQNVILLKPQVNSNEEWGLTVGDYVTISGSTAGNNGQFKIVGFDVGVDSIENRVLLLDTNLTPETPASTVSLAFRSKYDVFPVQCGCRMSPAEIDVEGFETYRQRFFSTSENNLKFYQDTAQSGKEFIEKEILLPLGGYSLTRYGRLSLGFTSPPYPGEKLVTLNSSNIIEPTNIVWTRALNNRRFYNEIDYDWDVDTDGKFASGSRNIDASSISDFGQASVLPIKSRGMRTNLSAAVLVARRSRQYLARYSRAAIEIKLKVAWSAGSVIESGDTIILDDYNTLKLPNISTGQRDMTSQLFEVLERSLDVKTGQASLTLLSGIIDTRYDRWATIAPSSKVSNYNTSNIAIKIQGSYGSVLGDTNEWQKWAMFEGQKIILRRYDYTYTAEKTIVSVASGNVITVDSAFPFVPDSNYIFEIPDYPTSSDPSVNQKYKLQFCSFSPSVPIQSGISGTQFNVPPSHVSKFFVGANILVRDSDYSPETSVEAKILVSNISGNTITVDTDLGFTPGAGYKVEFIGFADHEGAYRFF